jgi:thimet oligopeptidase
MYLAYNGRAYPANEELLAAGAEDARGAGARAGIRAAGRSWRPDKLIQNGGECAGAAGGAGQGGEAGGDQGVCGDPEVCAGARAGAEGDSGVRARRIGWSNINAFGVWVRFAGGAAYFPFPEVQQGVLDTAARLFHVQFVEVKGLELWDPSVSGVRCGGSRAGDEGKLAGADLSGHASARGQEQVVQRGHDGLQAWRTGRCRRRG